MCLKLVTVDHFFMHVIFSFLSINTVLQLFAAVLILSPAKVSNHPFYKLCGMGAFSSLKMRSQFIHIHFYIDSQVQSFSLPGYMRKTFSVSSCRKLLCLVKLLMCVKASNNYFMLFEIAMERTPKYIPVTIVKSHLFSIIFYRENMLRSLYRSSESKLVRNVVGSLCWQAQVLSLYRFGGIHLSYRRL